MLTLEYNEEIAKRVEREEAREEGREEGKVTILINLCQEGMLDKQICAKKLNLTEKEFEKLLH